MIDPDSKDLWHVVLGPAGVGSAQSLEGREQGGLPLEVVHIEPIGPERLQQLTELFAQVSAGEGSHHGHMSGGPCPICSPLQRALVADAVRRALWEAAQPFWD
jgi:hypothetical protein